MCAGTIAGSMSVRLHLEDDLMFSGTIAGSMVSGTIAGSMVSGTIAGAMFSGTIAGAILVEGSARGCYVRVGVGSVVPPPTHNRAKVGITN